MKIADIINECAARFGVTASEIVGPSHDPTIVRARHTAMFRARMLTGKSYATLGRIFGGRDWSTVRYGVERGSIKCE